ncbi:MAG: hypothetical protein JNJ54_02895 [Myxococcaceae bacterium]|nr:hypothetical protein [Myxococcaceae bacterium]
MPARLPRLTDRLELGVGLKVSPVCLGMVSDPRTVAAAFEAGINFFFVTADMHWPLYAPLREGLRQLFRRKGVRDRVVVCATAYVTQPDFCEMPFEELVDDLPGLERLEVLTMGGVYANDFSPRLPVFEDHRTRGFAGCRAIGASFHDRRIARSAIVNGLVDLAFVRFNSGHPGARHDLFPGLPKRRPRLFNFKSTDGWVDPSRLAQLGLAKDAWHPSITDHYRYAFSQPALDGALVSVSTPSEVRALADALAEGPLDPQSQGWLEQLSHAHLSTP